MNESIPQNTPQRQCCMCGQLFAATLEFFYENKTAKSGLSTKCKTCMKAYVKSRKEANKEHERERSKAYREAHKEEMREWKKRHYQEHKEEIGEKTKAYRESHKEQVRERKKRYAEGHKEHLREYHKQYYEEHKEQFSEYNKQRYEAQRDQIIARVRLYEKSHKEEITERRKRERVIHKERISELRKRRYQRHKEYLCAQKRHYYHAHKEQCRTWHKQYLKTERGQIAHRTSEHKRRANKNAVSGSHTPAQIEAQLKRQKGRCYYGACGHAKFEKKDGRYVYHIDHTYPLSRVAGTDIPANDISYLVLACPSCNLKKHAKFPWEWFEGGRLL